MTKYKIESRSHIDHISNIQCMFHYVMVKKPIKNIFDVFRDRWEVDSTHFSLEDAEAKLNQLA